MSSFKKPGYDHLLKLIIIGDSSVGKTCILLRFSEDNFPVSHMPTIGKNIQFLKSNFPTQVSTSKSKLLMLMTKE